MDPCEILATELVSAGFGLGGAPWGIRLPGWLLSSESDTHCILSHV